MALCISGKEIAEELLSEAKATVQQQHLDLTLVVFLVGDNPASLSYIKQKQQHTIQIGAKFKLIQLPVTTTTQQLAEMIITFNSDPAATGIILQQPLPLDSPVNIQQLPSVDPAKDVDGFVKDSLFDVPVVQAVIKILEKIYTFFSPEQQNTFDTWLATQHIVVIGRGETAGKPIARKMKEISPFVNIIHTGTEHPGEIIKQGDIIISCVGKEHTITKKIVKDNAIIISVGLSRGKDGKLHSDYDEKDMENHVFAYTPTPGGVGPVNVACLMHNLVKAGTIQKPQ